MRWLSGLVWFLLPVAASGATAAETAREIREVTFDREECYRVRDLTLLRYDVRLYLTDGYLLFSKPVEGRRAAAVFTTDVEGGDGEVIVMAPNKGERRSLAAYTGSPTLDEHFRAAIFLGVGDLYGEVKEQLASNPANRKMPEMGPVLDEQWSSVLHNLAASYETRLTLDILSRAAPNQTLFAAMLAGVKLGNFDVVSDPRAQERIAVGQVVNRQNRSYFDVWTSFEPRNQPRTMGPFGSEADLSDYRIEATVGQDLNLSAVTRVKVTAVQDGLRVLPLDIARNMKVDSVTVDGRPAEVLQREALRANLGRAGNELFLVLPPEPLQAKRTYELEVRHNGRVIHDAGDHVYYVSARGNWYPADGLAYASYDLTFRYPREFDLVSAGEVVSDTTDGPWRTTRRRTRAPIRMAGFNLGRYEQTRVTRGNYTVEVYANRSVERALQPKSEILVPQMPLPGRRRPNPLEPPRFPAPEPAPNPVNQLQKLASDIADALQFMAGKFGPPALPFLTVSPIPGAFGQGFPGLIYLSTLSYLKPEGQKRVVGPNMELFFTEILHAHETAHQWWGNVVSAAGYRDYWLMEALANYSALLYVEKHRGARFLDQALDQYRTDLLAKGEGGSPVDAAGPIVLGTRLESSLEPRAWRAITYGKGSWILQMLRRLQGDEKFLAMLMELRRRYEHQEVTTEQFRDLASHYLPPKNDDPKLDVFFDQWVYSTGIPAIKMSHSVKGLKVSGTITQSDVGEDFSASVPVEIQFARGRSQVVWVRTSNEPATFSVTVRQAPAKVLLDPHYSVLRRP